MVWPIFDNLHTLVALVGGGVVISPVFWRRIALCSVAMTKTFGRQEEFWALFVNGHTLYIAPLPPEPRGAGSGQAGVRGAGDDEGRHAVHQRGAPAPQRGLHHRPCRLPLQVPRPRRRGATPSPPPTHPDQRRERRVSHHPPGGGQGLGRRLKTHFRPLAVCRRGAMPPPPPRTQADAPSTPSALGIESEHLRCGKG